MNLTDLNPRFFSTGGHGITNANGDPVPERKGMGLLCDCPRCGDKHLLAVNFANPLDGGPPASPDGPKWTRTGETFDTLTLEPSILRRDGCKWHGWIRNGEIVNA